MDNSTKSHQTSMQPRILPWVVWGIASLFVLFQFMLQGSTSVMIPQLMRDFSIDVVSIGFLSASYMFTYIVLQIPSGLLVDRFGPRSLLTGGLVLCALACLAFAWAQDYSVAVMSRMLMGIVTAPAVVCALYIGSCWFRTSHFALIAGLTEMLGMFGGALGAEVLALSVEGTGWRFTMLVCALIAILLAFFTFILVRDRPRDSVSIQKPDESLLLKLKIVLTIPQVWINGVFSGLTFVIISAFASLWCIPFTQKIYGINLIQAASVCSMLFIGAGIGSPFMGWLSDRLKVRKPVMIAGSVASLFLVLIILYLPGISLPVMFVLMLLTGFASSVYMIAFAVVREITPPSVRGTALGVVNTLTIIFGAPILQPFIGWLLRRVHEGSFMDSIDVFPLEDYKIALSVIPICYALGLILVFFIRETHCCEPKN